MTETCDSSTSLIGDTDQSYNKVLQPANDNTRCVGDLETITLGSLAEKRQMGELLTNSCQLMMFMRTRDVVINVIDYDYCYNV